MRIRMLGIAPYEGLKGIMENVALSRPNIDLTVRIGDLSDGAQVVGAIQADYDVIVSRGGTARMIRNIAHVPVVDITLSGYDLLRVIRLAKTYNGRFAIVGFPGITNSARLICELIQSSIEILTINSEEEASSCLKDLRGRGYSLVIGDTVTAKLSERLGLNSILVTSGMESVGDAFDQAERICEILHKQQQEIRLLKALLATEERRAAVFGADGKLLYRSCEHLFLDDMEAYLRKNIRAVLADGSLSIARKLEGNLYGIQGRLLSLEDADVAAFDLRPPIALSSADDQWLSTLSPAEDYVSSFNALHSENPAMRTLIEQAIAYSRSPLPVLIMGEAGTGKDSIISALHQQSQQRHNTLVTIDANRSTPKRWEVLLQHENSPLCQAMLGLYFKNIQAIPPEIKTRLVSYIHQSQLHKRNRLYFSWSADAAQDPYSDPLYNFLLGELNCLTLINPPLRERPEDIVSLSGILINKFNLKHGKQVIGLTPEAVELLLAYDWPHNFHQLQLLINEAVILSEAHYITADLTRTLLRKLDNEQPVSHAGALNLERSLEDITTDILRIVLEQEGNNHSRTAQRLGISRGTLWRKLKASDATQQNQ